MSIWNAMDWVLPLRSPFFDVFFETVTLAGYPLFLILFLCFGYFALGSKRFYHTAMLLMATGLLNSWLKDFGQDPRPDALYALDGRVGTSYGWPSGHTMVAVVLWGYLAYTVRQNWAYLAAVVMIGLQAFSRLYLGVHDLGDVASGFVFGALCLAAYVAAERNAAMQNRLAALPLPQMLVGLVALHIIFVVTYPSHTGHHAPFWFAGLMVGWLLGRYWRGHEEVHLAEAVVARALVAAVLTGISFVLMLVTTRLPEALVGDVAIVDYGFGIVFGVAVTAVLPWLVSKIARVTALVSRKAW
ncbi:MAG: phosphatase PAP2 family protein [Parvibaculales bacterium]